MRYQEETLVHLGLNFIEQGLKNKDKTVISISHSRPLKPLNYKQWILK